MNLKFILDPASGRGKAEAAWPRIQKFFEERKIAYSLDRTEYSGHATSLAKKAVENGFEKIISIGGDGSANEIANGMIGTQAVLGIIPCGEGNDFSKMLDLPKKNIEEACSIIYKGFTKTIDVGVVNGRCFLNVVGIGIDGEIAERKEKTPKYLHGFYAYLYQVFPVLFGYKPKKVNIKIDGVSMEAIVLLIAVGNGRYCGGGFQLTPAAEIDDGLLEVCLAKYPGKLRTLWILPKTPKGGHIKAPFVTMLKAKEIRILSDIPLTAHIDGEIAKAREFQIKILPRKLKVLVKQ